MDNNPIAVGIPKPISSMSHRESLRAKADAEDSKGNRKSSRRLSTSSRHRSKSRDSDGLSPSEKAPHRRKSTNGSRHRSRSRDSDGLSPLNSSKHRSKSRDSDGLSQSERAPHRHKSIDGSRHRSRSRDDDGLSRSERAPHRRKSNDDGLALAPGSSSRKLDEKAAYRRRSNDGAALVPGAQAEKSSSRKSDEKAAYRRRSNDGPALVPGAQAEKSSSRKSDEKAAFRRRSNDGPALVPGAQAEKSSSRSRDEKAKERRSTRAIKPGAETATASEDKSKSKSSRRLSKDRDINVEGLGKTTEEGETVVAAMIVEDEEEAEAKRVQRDQARMEAMEAMVAANAERERQRMEAENERLRKAMELAEAERKAKKKKKRKMTICVLLFCLAVGAIGVAAFFALQGRSSSDAVKQTSGQEDETTDPSHSPSEVPSSHPSSDPSNSPTLPLKYERPSEEECEQVAAGLPLEGEENMDIKSFDIRIDIDLLGNSDILLYVLLLQSMIEEHIIPDLIGCPQDRNATELPLYDLTLESIRYAVAKSSISVDVMEGESCRDTESPTCIALMATITTTVREQEKIFRLISLLSAFFRAGENIQQYLQLQDQFNSVTVVAIQSNDPTTAPTIAPTGTASEDPTMPPTSRPSTRPTTAPAIGPTTPAPTKAPTKAPSKAPTPLPTLAPTATPPPTAAPQPGVTPVPTSSPSKTPTNIPSQSPSYSPSPKPSVAPSAAPSTKPSVVASSSPTIRATPPPTPGPTIQATPSPTSWPTADTTGLVSLLNSQMWMDQTSTYVGEYSHPATNALDGNLDTITQTNLGTFNRWRVFVRDYYQNSVNVNKVIIWNRRDCCPERLEGAVVKLYGVGSGNLLATSAPLTSALVQTVDFGEVVGVQWVEVHHESGSNYLSIAEIEAWGSIPTGPRLGFVPLLRREGMGTDQSSTFNSVDYATYALDGNLDSYSHTLNGGNEWWRTRVQDYYGQLVNVKQVTVWNRSQCCQERLEGAVIRLYGAGVGNLLVTSAPLTSAMVQTVDFGEVVGVQYVQVQHLTQQQYVTIGEIEAWGTVPNDPSNLGYKGLLKDGMNPDQSSTFGSSPTANNALNGNYDDLAHTLNSGAEWWRVNVENYYGQVVTVNKVTVWNRRECCQERLEGAVIKLYGAGCGNLLVTSAPLTSALVQTVDLGEVTGVAWVQIHHESRPEYLHFAQIEAWGKVP